MELIQKTTCPPLVLREIVQMADDKQTAKDREREERIQEILGAAFAVFAEKGYHKATLSEIAKAAGMRQGTLYYYYKTKDDIFWGVYDEMMASVSQSLEAKLTPELEPKERLRVLLQHLLLQFPELHQSQGEHDLNDISGRFHGFTHVFTEFWLHAERTNSQDKFYQKITRFQRSILDQLMQLLDELNVELPPGISRSTFSHIILALRDGLSLQLRMGLIGRYSGIFEEIYEMLLQRIFHIANLDD
ncbi:MAG: TetR/AcrR family transcriptional regulator [Deltaproteobacteria bacterium]|nr:MAG: TetR/AcrR family transcriptional regulator [Deltaproteobacteria bacterium]